MIQKQRRRLNIAQIKKYERLWNNFNCFKIFQISLILCVRFSSNTSSRIILIYMPPRIIVKMFKRNIARKSQIIMSYEAGLVQMSELQLDINISHAIICRFSKCFQILYIFTQFSNMLPFSNIFFSFSEKLHACPYFLE